MGYLSLFPGANVEATEWGTGLTRNASDVFYRPFTILPIVMEYHSVFLLRSDTLSGLSGNHMYDLPLCCLASFTWTTFCLYLLDFNIFWILTGPW